MIYCCWKHIWNCRYCWIFDTVNKEIRKLYHLFALPRFLMIFGGERKIPWRRCRTISVWRRQRNQVTQNHQLCVREGQLQKNQNRRRKQNRTWKWRRLWAILGRRRRIDKCQTCSRPRSSTEFIRIQKHGWRTLGVMWTVVLCPKTTNWHSFLCSWNRRQLTGTTGCRRSRNVLQSHCWRSSNNILSFPNGPSPEYRISLQQKPEVWRERFFKSVMEITREKREIKYVSDSRDQKCRAFFEKPGIVCWDNRIRF